MLLFRELCWIGCSCFRNAVLALPDLFWNALQRPLLMDLTLNRLFLPSIIASRVDVLCGGQITFKS